MPQEFSLLQHDISKGDKIFFSIWLSFSATSYSYSFEQESLGYRQQIHNKTRSIGYENDLYEMEAKRNGAEGK